MSGKLCALVRGGPAAAHQLPPMPALTDQERQLIAALLGSVSVDHNPLRDRLETIHPEWFEMAERMTARFEGYDEETRPLVELVVSVSP